MLLIIKGKDRMAGNVTNAWTNQWPRCCTKGGISGRLVKAAGKQTFYPWAFSRFFSTCDRWIEELIPQVFFIVDRESKRVRCDSGNTMWYHKRPKMGLTVGWKKLTITNWALSHAGATFSRFFWAMFFSSLQILSLFLFFAWSFFCRRAKKTPVLYLFTTFRNHWSLALTIISETKVIAAYFGCKFKRKNKKQYLHFNPSSCIYQ